MSESGGEESFVDLRQTKEYGQYLAAVGWETLPYSGGHIFLKRLPFLPFSFLKLQRPERLPSQFEFATLIRNNRALFSSIEPINDDQVKTVLGWNYRLDRSPFLPSKTLLIDLRPSEKRLLDQMRAKTRYNIGLAQRKGLMIKVIDGQQLLKEEQLLEMTYQLLKNNARRLNIFSLPYSWFFSQLRSFANRCFVVLAFHKQDLLAATLFLTSQTALFYESNASNELGRQLMAPTWCLWQGICEGKRRGLRWFDFEGVYDERFPHKRWQGFSRFKQGFGGVEKEFPGVFVKYHWPF